ncbi:DedA family protein [Pseudahrensia aquimaris]|uniref:DedA family protein n=1 Tax=Pseudahrensia aquimaris TaxID=744461 RepID=A0ABW3FHC8_9HYPH
MEQITALIGQYGTAIYILLFAYCALKSGSLPLFGGYAAYLGALDVSLVATAVLAGGYLGDEARFAVARRYGVGFLANKPRLSDLMGRARLLLERYGRAYIFLYRYPKGMRTIGALPVGLTSMLWPVFTVLNFSSAALWTLLLVGAGYGFGEVIGQGVAAGWAMVSVILLFAFLALTVFLWFRVSTLADEAVPPVKRV